MFGPNVSSKRLWSRHLKARKKRVERSKSAEASTIKSQFKYCSFSSRVNPCISPGFSCRTPLSSAGRERSGRSSMIWRGSGSAGTVGVSESINKTAAKHCVTHGSKRADTPNSALARLHTTNNVSLICYHSPPPRPSHPPTAAYYCVHCDTNQLLVLIA